MDRNSRTSETRETESRRKPWAPPSVLDAPPPPEGYKHRWVRSAIRGEEDKGNVFNRLRQGYEPVRAEEHPGYQAPTVEDGKHAGIIGNGGLILTRVPVETAQERTAYYGGRTREQMDAVDQDLMKEQHPSMPINQSRQSRVSFGGRKKSD
ncbi:MAG: hypothetical protein ACK5PF_10875 [bacterium]|jgi:hypothetical protein